MNIAFFDVTVTTSYGGIQTAIRELSKGLCKEGHAVTVIGGSGGVGLDLAAYGVKVKTFPYVERGRFPNLGTRFKKMMERLSFCFSARRIINDSDFDLVVISKPFDFILPWVCTNKKTKYCFMSGGTDFFWGDRFFSRKISYWVACSNFNAWQIFSRYKIFPAVIFNGVSTSDFMPAASDCKVERERLGLAPDEFVFAFAGRVVGWKGLATVIEALAIIKTKNKRAKLLIIGDGPAKKSLENLSVAQNVSEYLCFHPPVDHHDLPAIYQAADAGVFPSIGDEAFGITIAEAMSCSLPVLASYLGGIPEVVGNEGSSGILLPPGNVSQWANAMETMIDNKALAAAMGLKARQRIECNYTWDRVVKRLINVID